MSVHAAPLTDRLGRIDDDPSTGWWAAFTTDSKSTKFAWVVRYHPEHGRSVMLYRGADATDPYTDWVKNRAHLTCLGGYWWDGTTW